MSTLQTLRTTTATLARVALGLALGLAAGCQLGIEPGELDALPLQPTARFGVGSTFYLPLPAEGRWVLEQAPEGNDNVVVPGADGHARFTPVVPGDYAFVVEGTGERRTLTAVDQVPYEHFNYYPTSSLAMVDGELWVAHVFDPHVSRVDPGTGQVRGTIPVGPWPVALAHAAELGVVLVAHKAGDTLGVVDVAQGRLVDAVWVGDEPAEIRLSPDGATAYVSLATEDAVVVVDVARREVVGRVEVNPNPTAMAISEDGGTLYVASYRSGVGERQTSGTDARGDLYDVAVIDTASRRVTDHISSVGATIGGLWLEGERLYVATTRVELEQLSPLDEQNTAFRHTVAAYDTATRAEVAAVDLGRQPSAAAMAVRPFGLTMAGGTLWVVTEGSDAVVGLDPQTLAERARFTAEGRPRTILADGERLYVHGSQAYRVTLAGSDGTVDGVAELDGDPRPAGVAQGQWMYTGVGARGGQAHSCADCHVDGLTDGNVWNAGFALSTSRPMFWLEGTGPIGWEGDADDLRSYLYGSPAPTIGVIPTTESFQAFYDYLAALVPPPPANGWTQRDGSLTEPALRGKELFEGKAACAGCHAGALTTQGLRLPGGGTHDAHPVVVPSLVGAYRHAFWLVDGAARTLEEAVTAMAPLSGVALSEEEVADLAGYLRELTAREFFVLTSTPRTGASHVRSEGPLSVVMSQPVFDDPSDLARIELRPEGGVAIGITVEADGRRLTITPVAPLTPGQRYELVLAEDFEAFTGWTLGQVATMPFTVAEAPALSLDGEYVITVDHPNLDREAGRYDPSVVLPIPLAMTATASAYGASLDHQATELARFAYDVVIEGDVAYFPPFAFPAGPEGFFNRSFPSQLTLVDDDGDGVADRGESTLYFRSPGLEATDVRWTLARPDAGPSECSGQEGTHEVDLMVDAQGNPTIDWSADVQALGYYVTDPDAVPPAGPGPVTGGET
ncbi:MAG: Ig-like domain-containing protein, partial [Myxococcales bacterium]|nr:Ig-like domain-containing protein [Myxococcales bacterium]